MVTPSIPPQEAATAAVVEEMARTGVSTASRAVSKFTDGVRQGDTGGGLKSAGKEILDGIPHTVKNGVNAGAREFVAQNLHPNRHKGFSDSEGASAQAVNSFMTGRNPFGGFSNPKTTP